MSFWEGAGYEPSWEGDASTGGPGGSSGRPDSSMNPAGAASDPFAYTQGSLLTPWGGTFTAPPGSMGGYSAPAYKPFQFSDFSYQAATPGGFDERYADPGNFTYGDYDSPAPFAGVTDKDLQADKGYRFRVQQGQKALAASKAGQGVLKTGGSAKAFERFGQDMASQEYGQVYGRKASEYDRTTEQGRFAYGTNRANTAENFDRNVSNARTGYGVRQGAWKDNAAVALDASRHGYDVAQGGWDRNYGKARTGYEDERSAAAASASAGSANANQAYTRALDDYERSRGEFWTAQDRQYAILDREADRGYQAARDYGYAQSGLATDRGNAQASGRVGSANAWNGALGGVGQGVSDAAMTYAYYQNGGGGGGSARRRPPTPPIVPGAGSSQRPRQNYEPVY